MDPVRTKKVRSSVRPLRSCGAPHLHHQASPREDGEAWLEAGHPSAAVPSHPSPSLGRALARAGAGALRRQGTGDARRRAEQSGAESDHLRVRAKGQGLSLAQRLLQLDFSDDEEAGSAGICDVTKVVSMSHHRTRMTVMTASILPAGC